MSPFQALYGTLPPDTNRYIGDSENVTIHTTLLEQQRIKGLVQKNLSRAQQRMTALANERRLDKEFKIGDMVYVRLRDYRQQTVSSRTFKKLSKRFHGPFKVVERIGKVAYKLLLPEGSKVHPVFHVSLLRQAVGNTPVATSIPLLQGEPSVQEPEKVINHRRNASEEMEVLIVWKGKKQEEATWESLDEIRQQFAEFWIQDSYALQLEDELSAKEGAVDASPTYAPAGPFNSHGGLSRMRPRRSIKRPARYEGEGS